jgi:putative heme-binding domain-containing protein
VLDAAAPIDRRIDAALAMAGDVGGAQLLMQLALENRIAYQLREAIGSVIFTNPDRVVRAAAAGLFQRPGGQHRMTTEDVAARTGNASRGVARFAASCSTCHRAGGGPGADVGPDLTAVHTKFDRKGLIDAIVDPNAAIAFGFGAELFVTRDGSPQIGFLQSEGPALAIRDGYGRVVTIPRTDLAARVPLKSSVMPDPLLLALSEQDVADITAFLMKER